MKNGNGLKKACAILLIASPLLGLKEPQAVDVKNSSTIPEAKIIAADDSTKPHKKKLEESKKSSYKVDGRTSASKLVAKRSHSVSKKDEAGLSIFLGVIVVGVIVFFLKPFSEKK